MSYLCPNFFIMLSSTEENYLKAIYNISERESGSVTTNNIAHAMQTKAASVTDMIKKLAEKELVDYAKYRGVSLTEKGRSLATQLIRKHRLWETFLVDKLGFDWHEVHELAEELEHIRSNELINRLDAFLNYPKFDPHGDPIPNASGRFTIRQQVQLSEMHPGEKGDVVAVHHHDDALLRHLADIGIEINTFIEVLELHAYDQSIHVRINRDHVIQISQQLAQKLFIRRSL